MPKLFTTISCDIDGERERVLFSTIEQRKRKKTITTIAWKVVRKADQPIKAGDPLSYTSVTYR